MLIIFLRTDHVHKPYLHQTADLQCTGEAVYTGDIPDPAGCLYAWPIISRWAHAKIDKIDDAKARSSPGVQGIFYGKDLHLNGGQGFFANEPVFASEEVSYDGELIGVVCATTLKEAQAAALLVDITVTELPVLNTIEVIFLLFSFLPY